MKIFLYAGVFVVLFFTFYIGRRVGQAVPDEVEPSQKYLRIGVDALLLVMLGLLLFSLGKPLIGLAAILALLCIKYFTPLEGLSPVVSGVLLGAGVLLPQELFATLCLLCLLVNYVSGSATRELFVLKRLAQPLLAAVIMIVV